jgi:glycosyltransferase involved in cell wall biosynthesis
VKIAIYNRGIPFNGSTPFQKPLGGSESSIVHMARELARRGHSVTVYCSLAAGGGDGATGNDPVYRSYERFFSDFPATPWDVLVSFRSFDPFLLGRVAPRMVFWCGDAADQPALKHFEHGSLQQHIDLIFCVSNWHRRSFIEAFRLPPEKIIATRNGFCEELVPKTAARDWKRSAYSSTPFRGLDILLEMFPHMRMRVPALRLDVFSSMRVYGWSADADRQAFGSIYEAAAQPGVTWHGSVAQPLLLEHLSRTGLFLYPNTFAETSCMAAIEAQACGAVVVTTARAALSETVEHGTTGICLPGEPASADYRRNFIQTVVQLVGNPSRLWQLSNAARDRAFRNYRWSTIASEWTAIFDQMRAVPVHARWNGPLTLLQKTHDYLQKGNVTAASRVIAELDQTPFLRNEVEALKGRLIHGSDHQRPAN